MQHSVSRRRFFRACALSLGSVAFSAPCLAALESFKRSGSPRLLLSLAAYSFRQYFKDSSKEQDHKAGATKQIDLFEFVDYCANQGCLGAELTSYYFPKQVDEGFLIRLRRHCFLRGVTVSGTAVGNTFTLPQGQPREQQIRDVKRWIDRAAVLGAPHIRVFAGDTTKDLSKDQAKGLCIAALEECGDYAGKRGIFLGLENHGGIVAEPADLLAIVGSVRNPWVGINLDTGNFHTDDPYRDIERCAPYAVNVQMKAEIQRRGQKKEDADLARLAKILRGANYQGYVALEYESEEDPWNAVPGLLKRMKALFNA
jgi:sugar phosphate isomerase/epimerase